MWPLKSGSRYAHDRQVLYPGEQSVVSLIAERETANGLLADYKLIASWNLGLDLVEDGFQLLASV